MLSCVSDGCDVERMEVRERGTRFLCAIHREKVRSLSEVQLKVMARGQLSSEVLG